MKKITTILILTLLAGGSISAQQPDAKYKLLHHEWTINPDGTSDYHYRHEIQILRNRALTAYADKGETFITFNPEIEELTINEVYTLRPDGSRVEMPQNAFIYQLPSSCADCGRFNHIRELAMVHTGMELGCIIVVDYTIHHKHNFINTTLPLIKECPIEKLEVLFTVPTGSSLSATLNNPQVIDFHPIENRTPTSYSLTAENLPQTFIDSYLPNYNSLYPTLHLYNGTPTLDNSSNDSQSLNEAADAVSRHLNSSDPLTNIQIVRDYIVDYIHLNDIPLSTLGYQHATPSETWQSVCGTATDKAILLAALLNQLGYNAQTVGEHFDQVSVIIDTIDYRLDLRSKSPATIFGKAIDEIATSNTLTHHPSPKLDTLSDGFYRLQLPQIKETSNIKASNLPLTRTAPLQTQACLIQANDTYTLPTHLKMVNEKVNQKLNFDGIGNISISIRQSKKQLIVERKLQIEKSIIPPSEYAQYRQLIALWQSYDSILLRSKQQ